MDEYKIRERIIEIEKLFNPKLDQIRVSEDDLLNAINSIDAQGLIIARIEDDRSGDGGWIIKTYSSVEETEEITDEDDDEEDEEEEDEEEEK